MSKKIEFFQNMKTRMMKDCKACDDKGGPKCRCVQTVGEYWDMDEAGIEREYWDLTWLHWKGDALAKKKAIEFCDNIENAYENGLGMVLHGGNGTGKSMLSTMILKSALRKGKSIRFITMAETVMKMKGKISNPADEVFYEDKVKGADFLCLDNLGSEYRPQNFGPYTLAEFDILARFRRRNLLPTIITTNLSVEEFVKQYGTSISSLFQASSLFIKVEGRDFRKEQGSKYAEKILGK